MASLNKYWNHPVSIWEQTPWNSGRIKLVLGGNRETEDYRTQKQGGRVSAGPARDWEAQYFCHVLTPSAQLREATGSSQADVALKCHLLTTHQHLDSGVGRRVSRAQSFLESALVLAQGLQTS